MKIFNNFWFYIVIIVIVLLVITFCITFNFEARYSEIQDNGELLGYRGLYVTDKNQIYKVGQEYKITYTFFMSELINKDIVLVE